MESCQKIVSSPSFPVVLCIFLSASGHVGIVKAIGLYLEDIKSDLEISSMDIGMALGLLNAFFFIPSIGISALMVSCIVALHRVAKEKYNLCFSIGSSGYGAGMVLFPLLAGFLRAPFGWRGGLLIISALIAHVIPCAVGIQIESTKMITEVNDVQTVQRLSTEGLDEEKGETSISHSFEENIRLGALHRITNRLRQTDFYKDPIFNVIFAVQFAFDMVYCGWHSFLVPHVVQRGVSVRNTIIITFSAASGNTFSRLGVGVLTNHLFKPIDVYIFAVILNIGALLVDVFVANFYVMLVTSCFSAMSIGARAVVTTLIVRDRASPGQFDVAFSVGRCISGVGMFLGGYIGGLVADRFSSFNATFTMLPIIDAVVLILILIMRCNPKKINRDVNTSKSI
ncbi:monocarboxylate transporter 6-like isoform X2 [Lytechinus variegatus]|uniref:monocarboxylate transporter 6-like isoform X2 n=1 Tax=Lytechinus variegatus TaxID=7654 RepID=UPI001BB24E5B|nr:monocarboxylate transporter 6-like isoform X2 [Lytechinus variegatus]